MAIVIRTCHNVIFTQYMYHPITLMWLVNALLYLPALVLFLPPLALALSFFWRFA